MGCECVSKLKSLLLILMMIHTFMVWQTQGVCIEEERKALLEIKASLITSFNVYPLPTWVEYGSTGGRSGGECRDWERITCNGINGHVTNLSLSNIMGTLKNKIIILKPCKRMWPLNISLFLHFKELTSLDLSWNCLDNNIVSTGLGRLSSLKKLEILDLSGNSVDNDIFTSLGALTSLKDLHLGHNHFQGYFPALALENLETLDLNNGRRDGTQSNQIQGFERVSLLEKLKILNLGFNNFNESLITSLSALPLLKSLDLSYNQLQGSFPAQELASLTNLEELDLLFNQLDGTPSNQDCKKISRLRKLESIALRGNYFDKSIISCLSALPSLKTLDFSRTSCGNYFPIQELSHLTNLKKLDLSDNAFDQTPSIQDCKKLLRLKNLETVNLRNNNFNKSIILCLSALPTLKNLDLSFNNPSLGGSFPIQELSGLKELKSLDLSDCGIVSLTLNDSEPFHLPDIEVLFLSYNSFNGTLPMEVLSSFHHLRVLDLSRNEFVGSIPSTIHTLSSLRVLSFANNMLNGSLPNEGLCELKNLLELDLSHNMFGGSLPHCLNRLSYLKLLDISSNQFTGKLMSSLVANLTSLTYIDFGDNEFEGLFPFNAFSNHTNLEVVRFKSNNDKFEVETEEPIGWIPMFQLNVLVLSRCNINRLKESILPGFLLYQHKLQVIDLSHNSLVGQFPNWLIENNTMLEALNLRNNSHNGVMCLPVYMNANTRWLDMSENHMNGTIPSDIQNFLPNIVNLNLSSNSLYGVIPSSIVDLSALMGLDLSNNKLSGEVPKELLTNLSSLVVLKLSNNTLHGEVLSGNISWGTIESLQLDSNCFKGKIGNGTSNTLKVLDISDNNFIGTIPHWISNSGLSQLAVSNNLLEGMFPCGTTLFSFLDISQNHFSGSIPSCLNFQDMKHLHLGSNRFTGSIPNVFRNLTNVLTLDLGNNFLSGRIPKFLSELSNLRVLVLRNNNFNGSIPIQLCQLHNLSLVDLSTNYLSGTIPSCLHSITKPIYPAKLPIYIWLLDVYLDYNYQSVLPKGSFASYELTLIGPQDEVQFTTKTVSLSYKGSILNYMVGLDLSCNKLNGEIPEELGLLTQIHSLNLSHNKLSGPIPIRFSNLGNIESLDLSSNGLSGEVPSQLMKLNYLSIFNVSYNNLSGRLPEMKEQFATFTKGSYKGNPFLCGPPLENNCEVTSPMIDQPTKEGTDKWYDIDMACFYGSYSATWVVFLLGFLSVLYANPYWRRRWLDLVEECMYACYYFLDDSVRKLVMLFR